jgi:hypothetical protein
VVDEKACKAVATEYTVVKHHFRKKSVHCPTSTEIELVICILGKIIKLPKLVEHISIDLLLN